MEIQIPKESTNQDVVGMGVSQGQTSRERRRAQEVSGVFVGLGNGDGRQMSCRVRTQRVPSRSPRFHLGSVLGDEWTGKGKSWREGRTARMEGLVKDKSLG